MKDRNQTKDINKVRLYHNDRVSHKCKISGMFVEGIVKHPNGGSFGIEVPNKTRTLYLDKEVNTYHIKKLKNERSNN